MKSAQTILALLVMCVVTGCTQYWYQPGVSLQQAQADHRECFKTILEQTSITAMTSAEVQAMNACMIQKGYNLVFSYQIPKTADRNNPVSSPHWKLNGVAGLPGERQYPLFEY